MAAKESFEKIQPSLLPAIVYIFEWNSWWLLSQREWFDFYFLPGEYWSKFSAFYTTSWAYKIFPFFMQIIYQVFYKNTVLPLKCFIIQSVDWFIFN